MKKLLTFILVTWMTGGLRAQKFNHTVGLVYNQFLGTYGNMDAMGIQYNPQFQKTKGNYTYGIAFPLAYNSVVSSSRESRRGMLELPASFELSYTPCGLCSSYQAMSIFAGAGVSKMLALSRSGALGNFMNASIGIRIPVTKKSMEFRMNYSKSMQTEHLVRLGLSLAYTL